MHMEIYRRTTQQVHTTQENESDAANDQIGYSAWNVNIVCSEYTWLQCALGVSKLYVETFWRIQPTLPPPPGSAPGCARVCPGGGTPAMGCALVALAQHPVMHITLA